MGKEDGDGRVTQPGVELIVNPSDLPVNEKQIQEDEMYPASTRRDLPSGKNKAFGKRGLKLKTERIDIQHRESVKRNEILGVATKIGGLGGNGQCREKGSRQFDISQQNTEGQDRLEKEAKGQGCKFDTSKQDQIFM